MKQQLSIFCICATFAWAGTSVMPSSAKAEKRPEWLIRTQWDFNDTLPNHFRTMQSPMKTGGKTAAPSTVGLSDLKLSASAEFSKTALDKALEKIGKHKITIVDIRQEPHGYIDGKPVSWFAGHDDIDAGKNVAEINQEEEKKLHEISSEKTTTTYQLVDSTKPGVYREGIKPEKMAVSGLMTEEQLCKKKVSVMCAFPFRTIMDPRMSRSINLSTLSKRRVKMVGCTCIAQTDADARLRCS